MIPLAGEDGGKPKRRGCLRTLVVAAAVVVVLSMTAWFVLRPWLNRKVRAVVRHELATLGIHLSVGRTHLEPGRGIVFKNLTLHRNARRDIPVVEVSDVAFRIGWRELIFNQAIWGKATTKDATATFHYEDGSVEITDLNARLFLDNHRLKIVQADGIFARSNLEATGVYRWGDPGRAPRAAEAPESPKAPKAPRAESAKGGYPEFMVTFKFIRRLEQFLKAEKISTLSRMKLHLEYDETRPPPEGDREAIVRAVGIANPVPEMVPDPSLYPLELEAELEADAMVWKGLPLESTRVRCELRNGMLCLPEVWTKAFGGELNGSGFYSLESGFLLVDKIHSSITIWDLLVSLGAAGKRLAPTLQFAAPPHVTGVDALLDLNKISDSRVRLSCASPAGLVYRSGDEELLVEDFSAILDYQPPFRLAIENARGRAFGLDLHVDGRMRWQPAPAKASAAPVDEGAGDAGDAGTAPTPPPSGENSKSTLEIFDEWLGFKSEGSPPRLDLRFDYDQAASREDPWRMIEGELGGEDFSWRGVPLDSAAIAFVLTQGELEVPKLELRGLRGGLSASGRYDAVTDTLHLPSLRSDIDLLDFLSHLDLTRKEDWGGLRLEPAPVITGSDLAIDFSDPWESRGRVESRVEKAVLLHRGEEEFTIEGLDVAASYLETRHFNLESFQGRIAGLDLEAGGRILWKPKAGNDAPEPEAESKAEPKPKDKKQDDEKPGILDTWLDWLTFKNRGAPPRLRVKFLWDETRPLPPRVRVARAPGGTGDEHWEEKEPIPLDLTGSLKGGAFTWRGLPVDSVDLELDGTAGEIGVPSLNLRCLGGQVTGKGRLYAATNSLHLESLLSTIDPFELCRRLKIPLAPELRKLTFLSRPRMEGEKLMIELGDLARSRLRLGITVANGIAWQTAGGKRFPLTGFTGVLAMRNKMVGLENLRAGLFGGIIRLTMQVALGVNRGTQRMSLALDRIVLSQMLRFFQQKKNDVAGNFSLTFEGGGGLELASLKGRGTVLLEDAEIYEVPILLGLNIFLHLLSLDFSEDVASRLDFTYTLENGVLRTNDLKTQSATTRLAMRGWVDLVNKTADVKARLHFKGLLGIATGILSHLLEMEGEGPIDNMRWRMSKMPRLWGKKKIQPGQPVPPVNPPPPAARPPRKRIR